MNEQEAIVLIERKYHQKYSAESPLSAQDQLKICESLDQDADQEDGVVEEFENDDGGSKLSLNRNENITKLDAIQSLKQMNYMTKPKVIAAALEKIFTDPNTQSGYLLYVAQHYSVRTLNAIINQMLKSHTETWITIKNPSAYFSHSLKFYKKRKIFRRKRT